MNGHKKKPFLLLITGACIMGLFRTDANSDYHDRVLSHIDQWLKPHENTAPVKKPAATKINPQIELHLQQVLQNLNNPIPADEQSEQLEQQQEFKQALRDLSESKDEEDRLYAVTILGLSQKNEAVQALIQALNDSSGTVRQEAINQMAQWKNGPQQDKMTLKALQSDDPDVVYTALELIDETNDRFLLKKIKQLRRSRNHDIADFATEVYENLKSN